MSRRADRLARPDPKPVQAAVDAGRAARILDLRPAYERPAIQAIRRRRWRVLVLATVAADLLAIELALVGANLLATTAGVPTEAPLETSSVGWLLMWMIGLAAVGLYDLRRIQNPFEELRRIMYGVALGGAVVIVVSFSIHASPSRGWTLLATTVAMVTVTTLRRIIRKTVHAMRRHGRLRRRTLIVGADPTGIALARDVEAAPWEGLDVVGFVDAQQASGSVESAVALGGIDDLRELAVSLAISDVLVAPSVAASGTVGAIVSALDGVPVELHVAPGVDGFLISRLSVQPLGDRAMLAIERTELRPLARVGKRLIDLVLGSALLVLALPVIVVAAVAIRLDSSGPVFFRQQRIGLRGERFTMWKLRTMHADAEERRRHLEEHNESELLFGIRRDPRVTRVGRLLRRTSLDELPQLLNVLLGQMSLVGPRPPLPGEVELYDDRIARRLLVKPGITGLWQVSGRKDLSLDDYIRHDLLYVQNWSVALDLYILAKTIPAVLFGRGAY